MFYSNHLHVTINRNKSHLFISHLLSFRCICHKKRTLIFDARRVDRCIVSADPNALHRVNWRDSAPGLL